MVRSSSINVRALGFRLTEDETDVTSNDQPPSLSLSEVSKGCMLAGCLFSSIPPWLVLIYLLLSFILSLAKSIF